MQKSRICEVDCSHADSAVAPSTCPHMHGSIFFTVEQIAHVEVPLFIGVSGIATHIQSQSLRLCFVQMSRFSLEITSC